MKDIQAKDVYRVVRIGLSVVILGLAVFGYYRFRMVSITPGCDTASPEFFNVDRVIADRFPIWRGRLDRGDIVVYEALSADDTRVRYFAAIGAQPGETIENRDGRLWVNGEATEYPRVDIADEADEVPEERYLLFNTNPESRLPDSREYGFVHEAAIHGRVGAILPF